VVIRLAGFRQNLEIVKYFSSVLQGAASQFSNNEWVRQNFIRMEQ
jgi:hypothetical protein